MKKNPEHKWLNLLKIDPLPKLVEEAPLPVRYHTVQRFLPKEKERLERLHQELQDYKPRLKLIRSQQPDGFWPLQHNFPLEEQQKAYQFLQQIKNMGQLLAWGCSREEPAVQRGIIALLKSQKPDGKFPLMLHHQGMTLWLLVQYGLTGNPFVEKGFRWLIKRQRPDGGWISPTMLPEDASPKTAKSGIWTTLIVCQALNSHSRLRQSEAAERASNFLLENYLQPNHTTFFPEPDAWNHLYTEYTDNGMFRGGTLRFVEALIPNRQSHEHPNFKKAIKWLCEQQLPTGLFPAIAGKSQGGDYTVTLRLLTVLNELNKAGTF
jgi:hypothetical protein